MPGAIPISAVVLSHNEAANLPRCLQTLRACLQPGRPLLVATCIQALFQDTPAPAALERARGRLVVGEPADPEGLAARLAGQGYAFEVEVVQKGQAARRGGDTVANGSSAASA